MGAEKVIKEEDDKLRLVTPKISSQRLDDFSSFFQIMWRPVGCFLCLISISVATIIDPSEPKMWVAAAAGGVGVVGRTAEKITGMVKS